MVNQNAKVEFDGRTNLVVSGELLPFSEGEHDALVALVSGHKASVEFTNDQNVLRYTLRFSQAEVAPEVPARETGTVSEHPVERHVIGQD